jgi:hypothetical protein
LIPGSGLVGLVFAGVAVADLVEGDADAVVVDPAVDVAPFGLIDGSLEPTTAVVEPAGAEVAVADLMEADANIFLVDPAVHVTALLGFDGPFDQVRASSKSSV